MPIVHVMMVEGRSSEQKAELARKLTRCIIETLDMPAGTVRVLIHEVNPGDWFVGGVSKAPDQDAKR